MNWDDLKFFLALCREGTVSSAGRELGVKHTTVARRILSLEEQLGTRLFDQLTSGYAMTQAAENLFEFALSMETLAQDAERNIAGKDAELAGLLELTAPGDMLPHGSLRSMRSRDANRHTSVTQVFLQKLLRDTKRL